MIPGFSTQCRSRLALRTCPGNRLMGRRLSYRILFADARARRQSLLRRGRMKAVGWAKALLRRAHRRFAANTPPHPEERAVARVSKDGSGALVAHPSRLAVKNGEHLPRQ